MQDKSLVGDILTNVNSSLTNYSNVITQTDNVQLRNLVIELRNGDEKLQWELYQLAVKKGYYVPSAQADENEIQCVKNLFK